MKCLRSQDAPAKQYLKSLVWIKSQKLPVIESWWPSQRWNLQRKSLYWHKRTCSWNLWTRTCMKQNMKCVLFTDETRGTLDGPDGWSNEWVGFESKLHHRFRRHHGGGSVMLWAGIVNNEVLGPILVREWVKINSSNYCALLEEFLVSWLDDQTLDRRKKLIFMQYNAPSHTARATKEHLASPGFKNQNSMVWSPNSSDLNPIENLWSIIKCKVYSDGKQFPSKKESWKAIQVAVRSLDSTTIENLTNSANKRIFEVINRNGRCISKWPYFTWLLCLTLFVKNTFSNVIYYLMINW